jgi:hypothetical protein
MTGVWLENLKKFLTGTTVGSKHCIDVNVANTVAVPVTASFADLAYKEHRLHDSSAANIQASGGAFIQMATIADIANTCAALRVRNHTGGALVFAKGADATAAAAATPLAVCHEGGEEVFGVTLVSGDKLWVRAMKNTALTSGEVLAILMG